MFIPTDTGTYKIKGVYKDLESKEILIKVQEPLTKKILVEYYTSVTCGWCPWIGVRIDSLDNADPNVISYSIHGQDPFEIEHTVAFQDLMQVFERPTVRINRGYHRNFPSPLRVQPLLDSVSYFLSRQALLQLAIESKIKGDEASVQVRLKNFDTLFDTLYITIILVEDDLISYGQYNAFSGASYPGCPFNAFPNPIPEYKNHNILRHFVTPIEGSLISEEPFIAGLEKDLGHFITPLDNISIRDQCFIIAFVHKKPGNIELSSVLNAQIVKLGESVGFNE